MKLAMDSKKVEPEVIVVNSPQVDGPVTSSRRLNKKHVLIAAVSVIVVGLVVTCVLVGLRIYNSTQEDIFKYSMMYKDASNHNVTQTVSVAENSAIYHVTSGDVDAWILNDFDKKIQVIKVITGNGVACYVTPLNTSLAENPNSIQAAAPTTNTTAKDRTITYSVLTDPITDIGFLGSRVGNLCNNIPTYWQVRSCSDTATSTSAQRTKRAPIVVTICSWVQAYIDGSYVYIRVCVTIFIASSPL